MTPLSSPTTRSRRDLCPGVSRPWPADDGGLVRLRLIGGRTTAGTLRALAAVAASDGDGDVHLTRRANLQLRALPLVDGALRADVVDAVEATGLLPSRRHELVRNVMVSPLSGIAGGEADLQPVAAELDAAICADPALADLSARFLFVLDDGRGDLVDRSVDVGLVALPGGLAQVRWGTAWWGAVVPLDEAVPAMLSAAHAFLDVRPDGPDAPWHVDELSEPLPLPSLEPDRHVPAPSAPAPYGVVPGAAAPTRHVPVPDGVLTPALLNDLLGGLDEHAPVVVTPWRSLLLPEVLRRPTPRYDYVDDGPAIYVDSFATIRSELHAAGGLGHLPADAEKVVVRMVHGTGQVDLAADVVVHPDLVGAARAALRAGAPIITDAHMVASGVTRARLPAANDVLCALRDPRVPPLAKAWGTTRSAAALSLLADRIGGSVVAIGNAPTALFHLLEMLADGAEPPAAIVGCPVGFIGAAESKEALAAYAEEAGIPFLTVHGRRGGSAMTASAINALAQERE
ncbi:precorrin-8X methylmutase [Nocardioides alkalitolerans]|uniref:precorrin-8X methylmutase n=1 Tax=Nocardioides alkalitolerans TaxID=281714 RepID=UPI0003FADD3E